MTNRLEVELESFKERYRGLVIDARPTDLTECFRNKQGEFNGPKSYGNLEENVVLGYVVQGATLAQKYVLNGKGKPRFGKEGYEIRPLDNERFIASVLCVADMKSTSLHEVKVRGDIQGYKKWIVKNIEKALQEYNPKFSATTDTAFMFAGRKQEVEWKILLSVCWLQQIIKYGANMPDTMSEEEKRVMKKVFPEQVLRGDQRTIKERSYMHGRKIHIPESVELLTRKVEAFKSRSLH